METTITVTSNDTKSAEESDEAIVKESGEQDLK
ncbi:unnamed protein product, partial [Oppiella nova]